MCAVMLEKWKQTHYCTMGPSSRD